MADRKITDLTALAAGSQATGDLLTIVDVSEAAAADKNKKITVESLFKGIPGDVGIGTSSPGDFDSEANNLVVGNGSGDNGITIFTGSSAGDFGSIFFADSSSGGAAKKGQIRYEQNNEVMSFYTNESERLRIDLSGRVGIGTTSPSQMLHLSTNGGVNIQANSRAFFGSQYSDHFAVIGSAVRVDTGQTTGMVSTETSSGNGRPSAIRFGAGAIEFHSAASSTAGAAFDSERMRIDSSGVVKIGAGSTVTPDANADDFVIDKGAADTGLSILSTTTGRIYFGDAADDEAGSIRYVHTDNSMRFETASSERMRIDSSGNVGINEASPDSTLHVTGPTSGTILTLDRAGSYSWKIGQSSGSDLTFTGDTNERMRMLAGGGITFNGDTAAANALDDYEEGTWTPELKSSSTNPSVTYGARTGHYTKIGRVVYFHASLQWSARASQGTGLILLSTPFSIGSYSWQGTFMVPYQNGLSNVALGTGYADQGQAGFFLRNISATNTLLNTGNIGTSGHIIYGGFFLPG